VLTAGHAIALRGARVDVASGPWRIVAFGGATSVTSGAPFFRGGDWSSPLGLLFADRTITPRLKFSTRNTISARPTSIQALEWRPRPAIAVAGAGGLGNGSPYASASSVFDNGWVAAKAVVSTPAHGFRQLDPAAPIASEIERENVAVTVRPGTRWQVNGARQHLVQDEVGRSAEEVTVNQVGGIVNAAGTRFAGALFQSTGADRQSLGSSLSVGRALSTRFDLSGDYFRYAPRQDAPSSSGGVSLRTTVNPRLSLVQVVTRSSGQTSLNFGGEILTNPASISISYQTVYAPLRIGNPFVQIVGVDLRIHAPGDLELRAGTYATPDGRLKYTISGTRVLSRAHGAAGTGRVRLSRFLIQGQVVENDAKPLAGAVVQIGDDVVITDDAGRFAVRTPRAERRAVAVLTEEFLAPGRFEVVSAPDTAASAPDDGAASITIVLRRR